MSQRDLFVDAFDLPSTQFEIHEAAPVADDSPNAGVVDGENILARVVGTFFLVDGKSRNGRFYTRQLWEKAIKRTNDRMKIGQMLGTIGHSQSLDDAALLQGLASHRVARLWIDEEKSVGMGEILVLNTPSGRVLNAYLRGGVQFPVSSRGYGGFRQEKRDGAPIIDEDTFELETFDFVRVPGVEIAVPTLVESLDTEAAQLHNALLEGDIASGELYNERQTVPKSTLEEREMSEETAATIAALARQKAQVENDLTAAYSDVEQLRSKNETLAESNSTLTARVSELEGQLEEATKATAELSNYKTLGTVPAIQEVFDRFREMNARNKELSGVASANEALNTELEAYRALGSVEELNKAMDIAEALIANSDETVNGVLQVQERLSSLGTEEEISAALDLLETYTQMATPAELKQAADLLEMYVELGTVSEVEALVARTEQLAEALAEQKRQQIIEKLSAETGHRADVVADLMEHMGEEGARDLLARMGTPTIAEGGDEEEEEAEGNDDQVIDDEVDEPEVEGGEGEESEEEEEGDELDESAPVMMSRAGSLTLSMMEQYSRTTREEDVLELEESAPATRDNSKGFRLGSLMESCGH